MPNEIVHWTMQNSPQVIVDGTYGGGGHSRLLLEAIEKQDASKSSGGTADSIVIGLDRDPIVSERVEANQSDSANADDRLTVFLASYEQTPKALSHLGLSHADAMILDLGLSSDQLADRARGFSFNVDGPLDLRFDPENGIPASRWLATHGEKEIADAIYQFGEERFSRRIARRVVERARARQPVTTVQDMVEICRQSVPRGRNHDIHPATRTFQALRIVVNDELGILARTLAHAPDWLSSGGRMSIISFHSLEDRIVKNAFRDDSRWNVLTKKPLRPTEHETAKNPRSRSAKLRVAERV